MKGANVYYDNYIQTNMTNPWAISTKKYIGKYISNLDDAPIAKIKKANLDEFGKAYDNYEKNKPHYTPTTFRVYNNKVVKLNFGDNTFEKAVVQDGDTFDLDMGITICLCKRLCGGSDEYFKKLKRIKMCTKINEESKKLLEIFKEEEKNRREKKERRNKARREKRNRELAEAIARAQKEAK